MFTSKIYQLIFSGNCNFCPHVHLLPLDQVSEDRVHLLVDNVCPLLLLHGNSTVYNLLGNLQLVRLAVQDNQQGLIVAEYQSFWCIYSCVINLSHSHHSTIHATKLGTFLGLLSPSPFFDACTIFFATFVFYLRKAYSQRFYKNS